MESNLPIPGGEDLEFLLAFLQRTKLDKKGEPLHAGNSVKIECQCDGVTASLVDASKARTAVVPCGDLSTALDDVNQLLGTGERIPWREARWLKKGS